MSHRTAPPPKFKTLAEFERHIVNELLVDTPEDARAVTELTRAVLNQKVSA
jgi:hypothetical protein